MNNLKENIELGKKELFKVIENSKFSSIKDKQLTIKIVEGEIENFIDLVDNLIEKGVHFLELLERVKAILKTPEINTLYDEYREVIYMEWKIHHGKSLVEYQYEKLVDKVGCKVASIDCDSKRRTIFNTIEIWQINEKSKALSVYTDYEMKFVGNTHTYSNELSSKQLWKIVFELVQKNYRELNIEQNEGDE